MKLFSISGRHSADGNQNTINVPKLPNIGLLEGCFMTEADYGRAAVMIIFLLTVSGWMLSGIPTDESVPTPMVTEVVASVPVEEEVELVVIDQTEALAMGIDAVISSECKNEWVSDTTLVMVANVILNRTADSRYPDTVDQVLCQPYQFSCFSTAGLKWVGKAANDLTFRDRCMSAAKAAMNGERMLNYGVVYVSGAKQGTVEAQLDGLYFCR